jgi:hypothetical protein
LRNFNKETAPMGSLTQCLANDNGLESRLLAEVVTALRRVVEARMDGRSTFRDREIAALSASNEAVRQLLEQELQAIADGMADQVLVGEELYRRHQPGEVSYYSLSGPLLIRRWTYRKAGLRNGPTCVPVELEAGLIENATPALAYSVAQGYAKAPIRSVEQDLRAAHRDPPSRCTLERMAKAIGTNVKPVVRSIEQRLRRRERLPDGAAAVMLGLDRTSIPMEEDLTEHDLEQGHRPPRRKNHRGKPRSRVTVRYRMGYVGTVSITNRRGEVLVARRYGVAAHEGPQGLLARMMADLHRVLQQRPKLHVAVVQDNAPELWNLIRDALRQHPLVKTWHELVDRYHLMQRLAQALDVVERDADRRRRRLQHWRETLDHSDHAVDGIRRYFDLDPGRRWWLHKPKRVTTYKKWMQIHNIIGGYLTLKRHFQYASLKKLGIHTGSGVTEGACKSLIAMRAKRSGQRWRPRGIEAVLALRSLLESDRLEPFWRIFRSRYTAKCLAA